MTYPKKPFSYYPGERRQTDRFRRNAYQSAKPSRLSRVRTFFGKPIYNHVDALNLSVVAVMMANQGLLSPWPYVVGLIGGVLSVAVEGKRP